MRSLGGEHKHSYPACCQEDGTSQFQHREAHQEEQESQGRDPMSLEGARGAGGTI